MASAVHVVVGAGEVVADLAGDELAALDLVPFGVFVRVVAYVALGDEVVALGEPLVGVLGGAAVGHKVVVTLLTGGAETQERASRVFLRRTGIGSGW